MKKLYMANTVLFILFVLSGIFALITDGDKMIVNMILCVLCFLLLISKDLLK